MNANAVSVLRSFRVSGIAMFDLITAYLGAYIVDLLFNVSRFIPGKNPIQVYYLLVLPVGVLVHLLFKQDTFLNKKLFSKTFNVYQLYMIFTLISIVYLGLRAE